MVPVRPEPSDLPQIKRAFRAARFMRWSSLPVLVASGVFSSFIGHLTAWQIGLALFLLTLVTTMIIGYNKARCPNCGQVWGVGVVPWLGIGGGITRLEVDETETLVCRRCRLDIGPALRE
jgi:hypothetical protein